MGLSKGTLASSEENGGVLRGEAATDRTRCAGRGLMDRGQKCNAQVSQRTDLSILEIASKGADLNPAWVAHIPV